MTYARAALAFLRGIPWQVWVAVLAIGAVWWGFNAHGAAVKAAHTAAYNQGYDAATAGFEAAQAEIDEAQRVKVEALEKEIDLNNRKITHDYLAQRNAIAARADALRLRGPAETAGHNQGSSGDMSGLSDAAGGADAATGCYGIPFSDLVGSLEQAELNTAQLVALQQSINDTAASWQATERTKDADRTGTERTGESDVLPAALEAVPR